MACQTKGRRSDFRNRAGHGLTGQYWEASLDFAVFRALPNLRMLEEALSPQLVTCRGQGFWYGMSTDGAKTQ